jgi:hypothetical protein
MFTGVNLNLGIVPWGGFDCECEGDRDCERGEVAEGGFVVGGWVGTEDVKRKGACEEGEDVSKEKCVGGSNLVLVFTLVQLDRRKLLIFCKTP